MVVNVVQLLAVLAAFAFVALASKQIGALFARFGMPLISGFIFAGILAGPFVLELIPHGATGQLRLLDQTSLAVIAFAVGSKLYVSELHNQMKSILFISFANTLLIPIVGGATVLLLADRIPFLSEMELPSRIAVSVLMGTVLATRAPAVAIAIVNEMRAKGPFTQTVLGVTMVTDVAVIVLFAITSSSASAVLNDLPLGIGFAGLLLGELALTVVVGVVAGQVLRQILSQHMSSTIKIGLVLATGLGVYVFASGLREWTAANARHTVLMEPLLACLLASFYITNFTDYRAEFLQVVTDATPVIYVIFFTLVGAGLALDVLASLWPIAVALFAARVTAIFIASFTGGVIAGDPMRFNRVSWMTFLTQAGVGLGLAKSVAAENPGWGEGAAAMIVSAIVLSELVGPPMFKWAINHVGEAHTPAATPEYEGARSAIIFGWEGQSMALARILVDAGWAVRVGTHQAGQHVITEGLGTEVKSFDGVNEECMRALGAENADTIVTMLDDEENYAICVLAYERFGTEHIVVRLNNSRNYARFEKLGATVLDPSTAFVSLLAHFVRAPAATSLLLGTRTDQDVVDVHMRNPALDGLTLREIYLPLDALVLSVERDGDTLLSHGYTRLRMGDVVTVLGSSESLEQVALQFSA